MTLARRLASLLCTLSILFVGTYTVIAISIAYFIFTGTLTPGDDMYIDMPTPTIMGTLLFALVGATLTAGLAFARHRILSGLRL